MPLPLVAITMGDPAGIGPEIIAKAWRSPALLASCRPVVIGHPDVMLSAAAMLNDRRLVVAEVASVDELRASTDVMPCLKATADNVSVIPPAKVDPRGGQAAFDALKVAAELAISGKVDAIVTAPLHKAALHAAGHHYPGHTEMLADFCGVPASEVAMMLYLAPGEMIKGRVGLGVAHVTLHMALKDVFAHLTQERILASCRLAETVMRALVGQVSNLVSGQVENLSYVPRIGVAALNPHAGEEGLFGDEECRIIVPAVEAGRAQGLDLTGPLPCDTLMVRAAAGEIDAVVAMYHDQGHIALKLLGMHRAVNISLGLPIIRTSVAHGTAFDVAWQRKADCSSMIEAVRVAAQLVAARKWLNWRPNGQTAALR
jgi:4-phospho-D-threonate 3-dehydrogenase / 4-phospho-D-erythronate 3-dehydrogenase